MSKSSHTWMAFYTAYLNNFSCQSFYVWYLSFVGCHIVNITVGSYVLPDSFQGIKITDKFQSFSSTCIRTATNQTKSNTQKSRREKIKEYMRLRLRGYLFTASINFARMTDSIWDSASVKRWFKHRFQAPKPPRVLECLFSLTATLWSNRDVRYCNNIIHINHKYTDCNVWNN